MNTFNVISVNTSEKRGTPKTPCDKIVLRENYGIEGDAHAGETLKQVSLLANEDIISMNSEDFRLSFGDMAENITTSGLDPEKIRVGMRIRIGESELEITRIGKECHKGCAVMERSGKCIMPKRGLFARVLKGGVVRREDKGYYNIGQSI